MDYLDDPGAPEATGRVPGVVAAVRDHRRRLLLTRRTDNGMRVMPGGRIELGESIAAAAAREVAEETGVEIAVTGVAGIYTDTGHIIAYDNGPDAENVVLQELSITLHAQLVDGVACADGEESSQVARGGPGRAGRRRGPSGDAGPHHRRARRHAE